MGLIRHSSTHCQVRVGSCVYIMSCQAISVTASRCSYAGSVYLVMEAPGWGDLTPGPFPGYGKGQN
jgi:hypothetical protein